MTLTRFAFGFAFVTGSLLTVGACGDDGKDNPVDARPDTAGSGSDASIDTPPDAAPVVDYGSNEGGEVRLEYIKFPNNNVAARGTAFFYKNSGTTKFFPFLSLNGCTDLSGVNGGGKWPKAQNPDGEREYYDVGDSVTAQGGTADFVIAKSAATQKDPIGRSEIANDWYFNPAVGTDNDGAMYLPADTSFDIVLPGVTGGYAPKTYTDAVYMPAAWTIDSPPFAGKIAIADDGTDQTFKFTNATNPVNHPPAGVEIQNLVAITGPDGPAVICIKPIEAGTTTTVVMPAAMVHAALLKYPPPAFDAPNPPAVQLARQTVAHVVKELVDDTGAPTGRRIDFLGVWCFAGQGVVQPAP